MHIFQSNSTVSSSTNFNNASNGLYPDKIKAPLNTPDAKEKMMFRVIIASRMVKTGGTRDKKPKSSIENEVLFNNLKPVRTEMGGR